MLSKGTVVSGNFDDIKWGEDSYFVKVEFDAQGGSSYALIGTSQMLSVPYALYAEQTNFPFKAALVATNVSGPINNPENGMLVYNTATSGSGLYEVTPGYYYNAGTAIVPNWIRMAGSGNDATPGPLPPSASDSSNTTYGGITEDGACTTLKVGHITSCPSGLRNTGFGSNTFGALGSTNPSRNDNSALGYGALDANTKAGLNTAIGSQAMFNNTTASQNVAEGYEALYSQAYSNSNTSWTSYNVAVGVQALYSNAPTSTTTGFENTAIGNYSLYHNTTGSHNSATGLNSFQGNTTGGQNTGVGNYVDYLNQTGSYIAGVGDSALYNNTGDSNTAVGYGALISNTSGIDNTALGHKADVSTATLNYATAIGAGAKVNGSNCMALGGNNSSAYTFVGIGESKPIADLVVADAGSSTGTGSTNDHIKSEGYIPTVTTTYTCTVGVTTNSTDVVGNIAVTSGTLSGTGTITITFNHAYNVSPIVTLTPADCDAAKLSAFTYVTSTTTTFVINICNGGTTTGLAPSWNYMVIEPN